MPDPVRIVRIGCASAEVRNRHGPGAVTLGFVTIADVTRELLVRYLDVWTPGVLHGAKRATFAYGWSSPETSDAHVSAAEAALRVFAEFDDLLRGRRLTYVVVGPHAGTDLAARLDAVQAEFQTSANLAVHLVAGSATDLLGVAVKAGGAAGAPLLVCAQTDEPQAWAQAAGRPVELLSILPAGDWSRQRGEIDAAGFPLTTGVEFLADTRTSVISLATGRANNLEAFKNALWALDEFGGVRYRDPGDPDAHPMEITLEPQAAPLRAALLARLAAAGPQTVTELRHYALTETIYRSSDATRVISTLVHAGTLTSSSAPGRLPGDATVRIAPAKRS